MPLVSFVMPNRNKDVYLPEAITSLQGQTLDDIEIVVVDDDSTDDSRDVIDTFAKKDKRIVREYLAPVDGLPVAERIDRARNIGNQKAKADIICVADSDDWFLPERAKITYDAFKDNEKCHLFYGSFFQRDRYGNADRRIPDRYPAFKFSKRLLKETGLFFIGHITVGYKKETICRLPYDGKAGVGDWGMLYNILVINDLESCFTEEPLSFYRVYGNSMKEIAHAEHCDGEKTQYLWDKKQKKMETLGGLENV